jgi:Glycosyl hydrolase family 47
MVWGAGGRFERARDWVRTELRFEVGRVSVFAVILGLLGGMISGCQRSLDAPLMEKAKEPGARLAPALDSTLRYPYGMCWLARVRRLSIGD